MSVCDVVLVVMVTLIVCLPVLEDMGDQTRLQVGCVRSETGDRVCVCVQEALSYAVNEACSAYRSRYPLIKDEVPKVNQNLRFYSNQIRSSPEPGATIDEMLTRWRGKEQLLEEHHGYIQWLFPLRVAGLNVEVHPLQKHEAEAIMNNRIMKMRVVSAYRLMLEFFGLSMPDHENGRIEKLNNFKERLVHVLQHPHNLLRITRILQSLGELGWTHLQFPFVEFFVDLLLQKTQLIKLLESSSIARSQIPRRIRLLTNSCTEYWVNSIIDDDQWRKMQTRATPLLD